ncbi:MAG: HAD-IA family hydrolase [Nitrolancea sp.]
MAEFQGIQGILFDSGDTLMGPIGGEWLPGDAFRRMIATRENLTLNWEHLDEAHEEALAQLLEDHLLQTEAEELNRFQGYFTTLLQGLGATESVESLAREIAHEMIEHPSIDLFPDVVSTLERFSADGLKLGVISNGWPSLDRQLQMVGIRDFFDVLVVSAHVGSRKPESRIFEVALKEMDLPAGSVLLVDDALENVVAAEKLGMQGVVVQRADAAPNGYSAVKTLDEISLIP